MEIPGNNRRKAGCLVDGTRCNEVEIPGPEHPAPPYEKAQPAKGVTMLFSVSQIVKINCVGSIDLLRLFR